MSYEDSQSELTSKQTEDSSLLFIKDTEQSIDQQQWKSDRNCIICNIKFSKNRSHNCQRFYCKFCFRGVCKQCSRKRMTHPQYGQSQRCCEKCFNLAMEQTQDLNSKLENQIAFLNQQLEHLTGTAAQETDQREKYQKKCQKLEEEMRALQEYKIEFERVQIQNNIRNLQQEKPHQSVNLSGRSQSLKNSRAKITLVKEGTEKCGCIVV